MGKLLLTMMIAVLLGTGVAWAGAMWKATKPFSGTIGRKPSSGLKWEPHREMCMRNTISRLCMRGGRRRWEESSGSTKLYLVVGGWG